MTCANCGMHVADIEHHFYEGVAPMSRTRGENPKREWTIFAPLYYKSNADYTAAIEGYCGPKCASARMAY